MATAEVFFDSECEHQTGHEPLRIITEGVDAGAVGLQVGPAFVLVDDREALMAALQRVR